MCALLFLQEGVPSPQCYRFAPCPLSLRSVLAGGLDLACRTVPGVDCLRLLPQSPGLALPSLGLVPPPLHRLRSYGAGRSLPDAPPTPWWPVGLVGGVRVPAAWSQPSCARLVSRDLISRGYL